MRNSPEYLQGGGDMGALIRGLDWTLTPVGSPDSWPAGLRMAVRIMLSTNHPIFIFWGDSLTCFYNDAFARSIGPEKHPSALGSPAQEVFPEVWEIVSPQIELVMSGTGATWHENHLVPIVRHGCQEAVYWTYSYSPIDDPDRPSGVGGILVICAETTEVIVARKRSEQAVSEAKSRLEEAHHRVKNNLAVISALIDLERREYSHPPLKFSFDRISARLQSIATLYRLMLGVEGTDEVPIGPYVSELVAELENVYADSERKITSSVTVAPVKLPTEQAFQIGAIVVELLSNSYVHAFSTRPSGRISVDLVVDGDEIVFLVADDGVGVDEEQTKPTSSTGIGMKLVSHYVSALGATLDRSPVAQGTGYRLSIPVRKISDDTEQKTRGEEVESQL